MAPKKSEQAKPPVADQELSAVAVFGPLGLWWDTVGAPLERVMFAHIERSVQIANTFSPLKFLMPPSKG